MPSPLGHGLAGIAAGWAIARPVTDRDALIVQAAILAAAAASPDLDLLIHYHSGPTHSLGAAAFVSSVAALMRWPVAGSRLRIWLAVFAAYASHPLLDALSPDTAPPIGVMAFWPFSHAYVQTGLAVFDPIWRFPMTARTIRHDLVAMVREAAILAPVCLVVWFSRRTNRIRGRSSGRDDRPPPSASGADTAGTSGRRGPRAGPS